MGKTILTYFLTFILLAGVAVPSYISITEDRCETSLLIDFEDKNDGNEGSEETEFKIIALPFEFFSSYSQSFDFQKNIYKSIQYNSIYKGLESPPPELG